MKTAIKEILRALLIMARILLCLPLAAAWLVLYWTLFFGWGTKQADKFVVMWADMCAGAGEDDDDDDEPTAGACLCGCG